MPFQDRDENFFRLSDALGRRRRQPAAQRPGKQQPPAPIAPALGGGAAPRAAPPAFETAAQQAPATPAAPPAIPPEAGSFLQFVSPQQQQSVQPQAAPPFDLASAFQDIGFAGGGLPGAPVTSQQGPLTGAWDPSGIPTGADMGTRYLDGFSTAARGPIERLGPTRLEEDLGQGDEGTGEPPPGQTGEPDQPGEPSGADALMEDIRGRLGEGSFDPIEEGINRQRDESARMMAEMMAGRGMSASGVQAGLAGDIYQKGWQDIAQARSQWERQQTDQMMQLANLMYSDEWRKLDREQQLVVLERMAELERQRAEEEDRRAASKPGQIEAGFQDVTRIMNPFNWLK